MKIIVYVTLSVFLFLAVSCKSKKNAAATSSATTGQQVTASPVPVTNTAATNTVSAEQDENIRFIVSFFSTGQGIDGKMNNEFINFLQTYPKKSDYMTKQWGLEGEIDYYFSLAGFSASEQTEFATQATALLSKSKFVYSKENAKQGHAKSPAPLVAHLADDTYRFTVAFFSIGEGTDYKLIQEFDKFLNSYPQKVAFELIKWGREGETDYCLKLSELSASEQTDFIKKARELLEKSKLVHVGENQKCVHKH